MYYEKKKWEGMLGVRYDYNSRFGGTINPRLGISYKLNPSMIFRGSITTAFRPPSSYMIYNSLQAIFIDSAFVVFPSPQFNLAPEQLISVEIGWKWLLSKNSMVDVAFFSHRTDNHIAKTLSFVDGELFYGYQNSLESKSGLSGIQMQFSFKDMGRLNWYSNLSVNYAQGYEILPFGIGRIDNYREMPNWIGKWLVGFYPFKGFCLSVRNQASSSWISSTIYSASQAEESRVDGFYTADVLMNYTVSSTIQVFANFFNINDAKHGGISAVNDIGIAGANDTNDFTESLYLNPQYGARFTVGANISF